MECTSRCSRLPLYRTSGLRSLCRCHSLSVSETRSTGRKIFPWLALWPKQSKISSPKWRRPTEGPFPNVYPLSSEGDDNESAPLSTPRYSTPRGKGRGVLSAEFWVRGGRTFSFGSCLTRCFYSSRLSRQFRPSRPSRPSRTQNCFARPVSPASTTLAMVVLLIDCR
jgi:hypothetical protein